MNNPNSIRALIIGASLLGVLFCIILFLLVFSPEAEKVDSVVEAQQETTRLRPSDETVETVSLPNANNEMEEFEEWQEPVQQYIQSAPVSNTVIVRDNEEDVGSPYTTDNLAHLELGLENSTPPPSAYVPPDEPFQSAPPPNPNRFSPPEPGWSTSSYEPEEYDSLGRIRFDNCGEVSVPFGFGLLFFESKLEGLPAVECMGEAIGSSCDDARLVAVQSGEVIGEIFVTEFPDGRCGVGSAVEDDLLSLCSFKLLADNTIDGSKSESQWMRDFASDPAYQFAELYRRNSSVIDDAGAVEEFECELFEYDS